MKKVGQALLQVLSIARFEALAAVRRPSYLIVTFGLPVLFLGVGALLGLIAYKAVGGAAAARGAPAASATNALAAPGKHALSAPGLLTIHVVDEAGVLARRRGKGGDGLVRVEVGERVYVLAPEPSLDAALAEVRAGSLTGVLHLPPGFLKEGRATFYSAEAASGLLPPASPPVRPWVAALLTEGRVPEEARVRVAEGAAVETRLLGADGAFAPRDPGQILGRSLTPIGVLVFLLVALVTSSSYLLQGLADEKENRVLEVLVSSVEAERLLWGKLLGLGAAGFLQVIVWGSALWSVWLRAALETAPGLLALGLLYLLLGYLLLGSLMLGFGALGANTRESYQIAGVWIFLTVLPTYFAPLILQAPDSGAARALSLFPFTAPYFMPLRAAAGAAAAWELALSLALIALAAWASMKGCARLLAAGSLLYGKKPSLREAWRAVSRGA